MSRGSALSIPSLPSSAYSACAIVYASPTSLAPRAQHARLPHACLPSSRFRAKSSLRAVTPMSGVAGADGSWRTRCFYAGSEMDSDVAGCGAPGLRLPEIHRSATWYYLYLYVACDSGGLKY
ncbi:hypothetical protein HYPSUDRAFT_909547 [Hypholoma sublateritium FD-334 SS-4]|uniref:Uncharacterized protein n=1 Tax=Hypholoma sublateritium (strain FD-334 SS-4) TaxID=945553 RepID=A0A0D2M750_HYPSF|nr:hypothetical protein HYPSUDRAFT_909547 [Hypholoma sublateritium FD-334 SS-4]